ncbi:MAG: DUF3151 domain-containing protein [Phycicoccus sp.]|nr:DUF3151 domain-containing protein [Phycicoccus sp.]
MTHDLLGIPATYLPPDPAADASPDTDSAIVAAAHPASSLAWAVLAEDALAREEWVAAYAYARTGYHRGLDALRRAGWRGQGPIPWEHLPNRGFLRAVAALSRAADALGEIEEERRCAELLRASSSEGARILGL